MTVQEVFDLLNNVGVDFDGWYGEQCVDLAQIFNRLYKGIPLTGDNASDIWNTYPKDTYDRIDNTPNNFPLEGDVVIWKGIPGHIAIALKGATTTSFHSFDQNFPTGSRSHVQEHNYDNPQVLGWLRPKQLPQDQQAVIDQLRSERDNNWNDLTAAKATIDNLNAITKAKDSQISTLQQQNTDLTTQITSKDMTIQTLQEQAGKIPTLSTQLETALHDRDICLAAQNKQNTLIANLRAQVDAKKPKSLWGKIQFLIS